MLAPRLTAVVVLPTPPFWFVTARTVPIEVEATARTGRKGVRGRTCGSFLGARLHGAGERQRYRGVDARASSDDSMDTHAKGCFFAIPARRGNSGGVGATFSKTCKCRFSEDGYGCTGNTSLAAIPTFSAAAAPARSSNTSRAPFHATKTPLSRRSGAAYSTSSASGPTARAVTASYAPAPPPSASGTRAKSSARAVTERALVRPTAWVNRSITAVFRPEDSSRSTRARGRASASTSPGNPAPAPMSAIRRADASSRTSRPDRLSATWTSIAAPGAETVVCGSGSAASASRRRRTASRETLNGTYHQPAVRLVALAVRLHVGALAQIGVHDLALRRAHRLQLHRAVELQRLGRGAVGHPVKRALAALAVARGVDRHLLALALPPVGGAEDDVLQRVDRRAVLPDQETEVVAVDGGPDLLVALVDVHGRVQPERVHDPGNDRPNPLGGLLRDRPGDRAPGLAVDLGANARRALRAALLRHVEAHAVRRQPREARLERLHRGPLRLAERVALRLGDQLLGAHRRRPERFFFFRGDPGGAFAGAPSPPPAFAFAFAFAGGSSLPPFPVPAATAGLGGFPRAVGLPSPLSAAARAAARSGFG